MTGEDYGADFGGTSLNDLRRVNSNPFGYYGRIKHWLTADDFRSIIVGLIVGNIVLTLALVIEATVGSGPVAPLVTLQSSADVCTDFGKLHLEETGNTYDACILTSICLLAGAKKHTSLMAGGIATIQVMNSTSPPIYIDFTARDHNTAAPVFMAGMHKLKLLANEAVNYTYSQRPIIQNSLPDLIEKSVNFIQTMDTQASSEYYTNAELVTQLNQLKDDPNLYSSIDVTDDFMFEETNEFGNSTNREFTTDVTIYYTKDTLPIYEILKFIIEEPQYEFNTTEMQNAEDKYGFNDAVRYNSSVVTGKLPV